MEDNVILIGPKPFMNYVTGVVIQFTTQDAATVIIRARGKHISRAVDVAEITTKRFLKDIIQIKSITTNSESFTNKDKKNVQVSTIEIVLEKV